MFSERLDLGIREETLVSCYFFHGEETFLAEEFIQRLKKALISPDVEGFNLERFDLTEHTWSEVLDLARTRPVFFSSWRIIVVEIPVSISALSPADKKMLEDYLEASPPSQTVLVLVYPGRLRKTSALYKFLHAFPKTVILPKEVKPLKDRALLSWISRRFEQEGRRATVDALRRLAELTGNDLRQLHNEIQKIVTYAGEKRIVEPDDVTQVTGWVRTFVEWEISDCLEKAEYRNCLLVLDKLMKKEGVSSLLILGVMVRFFREILLAKLWLKEKAKDRRAIFRELKPQIQEKFVSLYRTKFMEFFSLVEALSLQDLEALLGALSEADRRAKTTGQDLQTLLEVFLWDYCRLRRGTRVTRRP